MSVWNSYLNRMEARGITKREALLNRTVRRLSNNLDDSLSYHGVTINDEKANVVITDTDNLNIKTILSLPGETFDCGSLIFWMENYWLVTELDANQEIRTKGKMTQCNYLLHWIDKQGEIHEQWCIIEDGTKYLTGELEDRNFVTTRGDSRIAMTIARNNETVKFDRESRFLIDDDDSEHLIAYQLTKPLKVGKTYGNKGVYAFVLQEVVTTDNDNQELKIADYYKYNQESNPNTEDTTEVASDSNRKGWL